MTYADFLAEKIAKAPAVGIDAIDVHPSLYDWQAEIVRWAAHVGRAAIWADTGLGKTRMQIEWIRNMIHGHVGLIVAPLAVCHQTVREAAKLGIDAEYVRGGADIGGRPGLYVTNYEMVQRFDPADLSAVVLDEASILKNSSGKMRDLLIGHFENVPYRLACTATPAPNDPEELTNQAEFLGQMRRNHMLAAYFVHDDEGWRLKKHGRRPMLRWMATWAVAIRKPSDMGHPDDGYDLPGLDLTSHLVDSKIEAEGQLFATELGGVGGRAKIRKQTLADRCALAAELVNNDSEPWILWCGLNDEAKALSKAIPDAVNVHGSLDPDEKARLLLGFADGDFRVMITKPSIASQGLNYQHCHKMAFVGLSDSYEAYYQAIRRCYRYGQQHVVEAHIVLSDLERQIADNIARKERQASDITASLVAEMATARKDYAA